MPQFVDCHDGFFIYAVSENGIVDAVDFLASESLVEGLILQLVSHVVWNKSSVKHGDCELEVLVEERQLRTLSGLFLS